MAAWRSLGSCGLKGLVRQESKEHSWMLLFPTPAMPRPGPNPPGMMYPMGKAFSSYHHMTDQWCELFKDIKSRLPILGKANRLKPEGAPSGGLVLSAFHNPAPTGSYSSLSRMDWLRNILLVKQFKHRPKKKKHFLDKLASFHLSFAVKKTHTLSVYFPWYCMYGSVPLTESQCNNWGKFQSMLFWFTSHTVCASDQLKSMLPGTWTVLLLPNQCWAGQNVPLALSTKAPCGESGTPLHTVIGLG